MLRLSNSFFRVSLIPHALISAAPASWRKLVADHRVDFARELWTSDRRGPQPWSGPGRSNEKILPEPGRKMHKNLMSESTKSADFLSRFSLMHVVKNYIVSVDSTTKLVQCVFLHSCR